MADDKQVEQAATTAGPYLSRWRLAVVILSLFLGVFLLSLDTSIIGVAIPAISSHFHALDDVAWYGTAYVLTITAFQPLFGNLYKFFDVAITFRSCLVIFEGWSPEYSTFWRDPFADRWVSGLDHLRRRSQLQHVYCRPRGCGPRCGWHPAGSHEHHCADRRPGETAALHGDRDQRACDIGVRGPRSGRRLHDAWRVEVVFLDVRLSLMVTTIMTVLAARRSYMY